MEMRQLTDEEIQAVLAKPKFLANDLEWKSAPTNTAFFQATSPLADDNGVTIPGLSVDLQYRRGMLMDECKYKFTIFLFRGRRHRLYQIEVVPPDQPSHTENGKKWYGPHQHFGDRAEKIDEKLGCNDHEEWFKVFLKRANIGPAKYMPPPPLQQGELPLEPQP